MAAQEAESTSIEGTIKHGQNFVRTQGILIMFVLKKKFQDSNSMSSITSTSIVSCVRADWELLSGDDL